MAKAETVKKKYRSIYFPIPMLEQIQAIAGNEDRSVNKIVIRLLEGALKNQEQPANQAKGA